MEDQNENAMRFPVSDFAGTKPSLMEMLEQVVA